jgi:hypothetical protein
MTNFAVLSPFRVILVNQGTSGVGQFCNQRRSFLPEHLTSRSVVLLTTFSIMKKKRYDIVSFFVCARIV